MYAYIEGNITYKDPTYVVLDVNGVGYELRISLNTFDLLEQVKRYKLHTHFYVKEDAQYLFGFATEGEKYLFLDLLSISGVGPSLALMLLSSMKVDEIKTAIVQGDVKSIQRVKGIGAKTAQRLVLELQDKLKKEGMLTKDAPATSGGVGGGYNTTRSEALSALITLGISRTAAEKSIEKALSEWQKKNKDTAIRLEDLIKLALKTT